MAYVHRGNAINLFHNQAYGDTPRQENQGQASHNSNTMRTYEVIPPLMHEPTKVNDKQDTQDVGQHKHNVVPDREQTRNSINTPQQHEEGHNPGEMNQPILENYAQDYRMVFHSPEPQLKEEVELEDRATPYEVPVPTLPKTKT